MAHCVNYLVRIGRSEEIRFIQDRLSRPADPEAVLQIASVLVDTDCLSVEPDRVRG